jgi:hypothetical protein
MRINHIRGRSDQRIAYTKRGNMKDDEKNKAEAHWQAMEEVRAY